MFSMFIVGRSFCFGHFKSSTLKVWVHLIQTFLISNHFIPYLIFQTSFGLALKQLNHI